MSNYTSSWKRNRPRKPLDLDTLKLRLTAAIREIEEILMTAEDDERQIKIQAANTMAGLANRYHKLIEVTDLEERITALEESKKMRKVS
jgi:hypothetical protein